MSEDTGGSVANATVDEYKTFLNEPGRPPSRGGNTKAWHSHALHVDGLRYSFLALGQKKWVFSGDTVSFDWLWDDTKRYRNIVTTSLRTVDRNGKPVVRGLRGSKPRRFAEARMPASQREQRD